MSNLELDTTKSFQNLILKLQSFWAEKGCAIVQPFDMEVGAGSLFVSRKGEVFFNKF